MVSKWHCIHTHLQCTLKKIHCGRMVVGETKGIHHHQERDNSVDIYLLIYLSLCVLCYCLPSGWTLVELAPDFPKSRDEVMVHWKCDQHDSECCRTLHMLHTTNCLLHFQQQQQLEFLQGWQSTGVWPVWSPFLRMDLSQRHQSTEKDFILY